MEELLQKIEHYIFSNDTLNWGNLSAMEIAGVLMRCVFYRQCPLDIKEVTCIDFIPRNVIEYCCFENCIHWNQNAYACRKVSDRIHRFDRFKQVILRKIIEHDLKDLVYGWID